jgi:hypothetical protein
LRAGRLGFIDLLPLLRVHREYFWHLFQPDRLSGEMKHFAGRQFVIFLTLLVTGKGCAILFSRLRSAKGISAKIDAPLCPEVANNSFGSGQQGRHPALLLVPHPRKKTSDHRLPNASRARHARD